MSCGCNNFFFPYGISCRSSRFPACDQFSVPYLKTTFTVPASLTDVSIEVTSTDPFFLGQGIKIGAGYFFITEITSSTVMKIQHNGKATPNTILTAVDPINGCYQYPISDVGLVVRNKTDFSLAGYGQDGISTVASSITASSSKKMKWGYLGPTTIHFSVTFEITIANTPYFIGIGLPGITAPEASTHHDCSVSASFYDGTNIKSLTSAMLSSPTLLVGPGDGTAFANGSSRDFYVSGTYETFR